MNGLVFRNRELLMPSYVPEALPHRERELNLLESFYVDALRHVEKAYLRVVQIVGSSGTGKTCCVKKFGENFQNKAEEKHVPLKHVYMNCQLEASNRFTFYVNLLEKVSPEIATRGVSPEEMLRRLIDYLSKIFRFGEGSDEGFIEVQQNGKELHFRYTRSQNGKFIVVWKMSLDSTRDRNKQVCLIENNDNVRWCEKFEIVDACYVSNNGTVVVLVHNIVHRQDIHNRPSFLTKDSIVIIPKSRDMFQLKFSEHEEIMALAISQNGEFLVYNLQRYRPDDYQLVLYNIHNKREEWCRKYSRKQVVHELVFKDDHILVYAGPRPSAYVDRRYVFTLDLKGKIMLNDHEERRKQEERDSLATRADDLAGQAGGILRETLVGIAPTIEVIRRRQFGTRMVSRGLSDIMSGRRPLPALCITICPNLHRFHAEPSHAKIEKEGCRFFFCIHVVARTAAERDKISQECIQTLLQQENNLEKRGLVFATKINS